MKVYSFFKLLNHKIKQYEKAASYPFANITTPITIIWIENSNNNEYKD